MSRHPMGEYNDGGPAFPLEAGSCIRHGMTLRDYFAAKAMQGWMANMGMTYASEDETAAQAYAMADAFLKARQS